MRTTPWDWNHAPTSVNPIPAKSDSPKHIVDGLLGPPRDILELTPDMGRIELLAPQPAAIAAFLDTVRRLNNSVTWGEVEPGTSVMRWLEQLASE